MEARVAVLEQIAKDTRDNLLAIRAEMKDIRAEMKDIRAEMKDIRADQKSDVEKIWIEMRGLRADQKSDFRWLLGLMIMQFGALAGMIIGLAGLMAHGFGWF